MNELFEIVITNGPGMGETHLVNGPTTIGRDGCDINIGEETVSRRHAEVEPADDGLTIHDLDSSNGTFVSGKRIDAPVLARPGDIVVLGTSSTFVVRRRDRPEIDSAPSGQSNSQAPESQARAMVPSLGDEFNSISRDGIEVRWIERSAGKRAAKSMLDSARRARKALAGFGSEPEGQTIVMSLIDPIVHDGVLVTGGSIIDLPSKQIWAVVSPESSPEDPTRAMALLFGSELPNFEAMSHLIAGYGLHLSGNNKAPAQQLAGLDEPHRSVAAAAFVKSLIDEQGDDGFRRLLEAPAGQLDAVWTDTFGAGHALVEGAWGTGSPAEHRPGDFLRLAVKHLKPYKVKQAEVFVYMIMSLAFTSVYPFVTRRLFDDVIPSGEFSRVISLLGALLLAFAVSLAAGLRRTYQSAYISGAVVRDLRHGMFARVQRLQTSELSGYPQGDMLARMFGDIGRLEGGLSAMINTGVFQFVSLVVAGAIMLTVNPLLGLVVIIGAPIVGYVYRRMGAGAQERSVQLQEDHAALMTVAAENYQAGPVVRLFQLEGHEESRFGSAADRLLGSTRRMALFSGIFGLSVNMIVTIMQVTILGLGTWLIFEGRFTLGGLVAFLGVMGEFIGPVTELTSLGQTMQTSMGSLTRIEEITKAQVEPAGDDLPDLSTPLESIVFKDLSFSYGPERRTLDEINVTIPVGTRTAFVGPSGSGKSTVLQLLMRMYEPDEGAILVDGIDVTSRSLASLRSQMGVVFQDSFLFDVSLADNIALGADSPDRHQIEAAADAAEISAFVDRLSDGLDSPVGEGGSNLSGGQRQRVAIARALIADPSILLLDEATSALDAATEGQINETIDRASANRTVITVTHRLTSIADYDLIVVLVDGQVGEQGTHEELLTNASTYARLWSEQTGAPMPERPLFDVAGALESVSMFRGLAPNELDEIASSMHPYHLDAGSTWAQNQGDLVLVADGEGTLVSSDHGEDSMAALRPGDYFGVNTLLGSQTEAVLHAAQSMVLLVLTKASYDTFVRAHPGADPVAIASRSTVTLPSGSRALARATIGADSTLVLAPGTTAGRGTTLHEFGGAAKVVESIGQGANTHASVPGFDPRATRQQ